MSELEALQTVVASPEVEPECSPEDPFGLQIVVELDDLRLGFDKGVSVLGEPATGGEEQATMLGYLDQQRLDRFQGERESLADELGVVV
jgi:hypothetical protein